MSMTERGVHITLLSHCWLEGSVPGDLRMLARMVGMKELQFTRMWATGPLHHCYQLTAEGRFINARLEEEREKQASFRRRQSDAAASRWQKSGNAVASERHCQHDAERHCQHDALLSASASASPKKKEEEDLTPVVLVFPVTGDPTVPTWALTQARVDGWRLAYPHLDVLAECRKALAWIEANHPKTARGMPAFLVRWLGNATNHTKPTTASRRPSWAQ